jgi:hypothetical protein
MVTTPMSIAAVVSASTSEIRAPLQLKTRQRKHTSVDARCAALGKCRRSAALRYFRASAGPYRAHPGVRMVWHSPETEWPILFHLRGSPGAKRISPPQLAN